MKTRVIQDQPEQPGTNGKEPLALASAQMQRAMNIAGRMGAWSAGHWKTVNPTCRKMTNATILIGPFSKSSSRSLNVVFVFSAHFFSQTRVR